MDFQEAINIVRESLVQAGSEIDINCFDGIIVKKLTQTNTIVPGRAAKTTHIAITGKQMDMFPYIRADGYFDVAYQNRDKILKKFFVIQISVYLHKENLDYLDIDIDSLSNLFPEKEQLVYVSVYRARRDNNQSEQIQLSMKNMDSDLYTKYRENLKPNSYMILLKRKKQLVYDLYCLKEGDAQERLESLNNEFYYYKDINNNTAVKLDDIVVEEENYNSIRFELPKGFSDDFPRRYLTSLLAKPFVILTGNSGTGKTRIAKQFAQYLEVKLENGEKNWLLVPVGADWTDNTKILGFFNPLAKEGQGDYVETEILKLVELANQKENKSIPFFIILDEMNLSHVELYFADFLSHMETPDVPFKIDGYPGVIQYPDNLFIVGTVNIDETTYMFSPKVLDRANVIEFKPDQKDVINLIEKPADIHEVTETKPGIAQAFLNLARIIQKGNSELTDDKAAVAKKILNEIYEPLEKCGFEFSFRTVKEIRQYISAAYELNASKDDFNVTSVVDEQILQKVLPKIHGSQKEIGVLLKELKDNCEGNQLKLSLEKINKMIDKLERSQYASFI